MINNSPFDDHIKKQFGNYRPEVPPHIWQNILAQKKERKPGGFLFNLRGKRFTLILLLLIATAGGALLFNTIYKNNSGGKALSGDQSSIAQTTIKDENNRANSLKKESKEGINSQKNKSTNKESSVLAQPVHANDDIALLKKSTADRQSQSVAGNEKTNVSTSVTSIKAVNIKNVRSGRVNGLLAIRTAGNNAKNKDSRYASSTYFNTDGDNNNISSPKNKTKRIAGKAALVMQSPEPETSASIQDLDAAFATSADSGNEVPVENRYLNLNNKNLEKTFSFNVKSLNLPSYKIPCPGGKNRNGNRYFEIYGGPDYAFRSFNDTANSTYLQKRKQSTRVSSAFSFGLRYTKVFANGISFRTGLNYSQVNEKFKFEQGHIVQLNYMINEYGDTTGSYASTGTRYKTTHNRYRTIDIPLLIGYETGNERFRANFNAGFIVNAYSWQKGDVLDSAYQPVNITTGKSTSAYQFKTNVGLGVTGGVSLYYRLSGKLYFLAEPYFRYNFSAANKADITLKQKYTTLGLRLGLKIDF